MLLIFEIITFLLGALFYGMFTFIASAAIAGAVEHWTGNGALARATFLLSLVFLPIILFTIITILIV